MKLHEYQAKELLQKRGVLTLPSRVCFTLDEVKQGLRDIGVPCVIKAQVHAGGRGKAGGIKLAKDETEALKLAETILSMKISTAQTGGRLLPVSSILIEGLAAIKHELYFGMVIDRATATICLMASRDGGTDIEEVAAKNPQSIKTVFVHKSQGLLPYQIRKLALLLNIKPAVKKQFMSTLLSIYRTFVECDASMIEINPLIISDDDRIIALDAKMLIDDNALFRQPSISELRDSSQEDKKEVMAERHSLSYVALDGNIGCMVNGAGLAMATMDVIKHVGGHPANFLDVGGSATSERVEEALRIIVSDQKVKAIFVNVFGGIAKCDVIAEGVVKAAKSLNLKLPLIVRLQGTNVELGRNILDKSGLAIIAANNLLEGAQMAVAKAS